MSCEAPTTRASRENRCESTSLGQVLSGLSRDASTGLKRAATEKFCNFSIYLKLNIHTLESDDDDGREGWVVCAAFSLFAVLLWCRWMNDFQICWEDDDGEKKRRMQCCAMIFFLLIWIISSALFLSYIYIFFKATFSRWFQPTTQVISLLFKSRKKTRRRKKSSPQQTHCKRLRDARSSLQVSVY